MVLVSVSTTTLATSSAAISTSLILIATLISTMTGLIILLPALSLDTILVTLILGLIATHLSEKCIDELLSLSVITALSFLFFLLLSNPHLDRNWL